MESVIILYFIFGAWQSYLLDDYLWQIFQATTQTKSTKIFLLVQILVSP